ncbi:MAG: Serine/threonine protein kinase [Myxococcaceae bacterium]|nr:Serine/threonine protein kinase [Myxococcaceae bacterium]
MVRSELLVGTTIAGRYRVTGILGTGGMGTVYDAEQIEIRRPVAIKVLHSGRAQKKNAIKRFQREARLASSLGLPEVVEVYDVGTLVTGEPYFVMERLEGETLRQRMVRDIQMPMGIAIAVICQVLAVLGAAHARGVIHRDIKPENIFLLHTSKRTEKPRVKLIDFGVAKFLAPIFPMNAHDPDTTALTATGIVVGTPWYVAPEQARGAKNVDGRADLWACGVIFYEMVAGRRPFETREMLPASTLRPGVPHDFDAIINQVLRKDPDHRFQTAWELLQTIEAFWDFHETTAVDAPVKLEKLPFAEPDSTSTTEAKFESVDIPIFVTQDGKTMTDEWMVETLPTINKEKE